ncbi:carbohydrate ABC transporter permease [Subtercola frigoramans]|uniref:Multiple sugar transport system permease protein n=1 Tax=Subtercola frigoramans TaxID=120298 RepID=A0ABS2L7M9_9MICO|nr:carbohydrate ABC transporter permease [Subtercola frigoramans]MBM7473111.1 multiple sugar transport system permease protein [Subtercola frigoramans]
MRETTSFRVVRSIVLAVLFLFAALPIYVIVTSSFKPLRDVSGPWTWLPEHFTIDPYITMWRTIPLAKYFANSLIVSVTATVLSLLIAIIAAYALTRLKWRGQRSFSLLVLSTQMFPGILFLLPLYLLFIQIQRTIGLQLNGSYLGLIITYLTFSLPFAIWMLMGFFAAMPEELEEAAMIDGTSRLGGFIRVILPIARPGIVAVGVFAFMNSWGEVLFASVLTTTDTRTLAVGMQAFATNVEVRWNEAMAASIIISLPVLIAFLLVQRNIVQGLSAGAVK